MPNERSDTVGEILEAVREVPSEKRAAFLRERCEDEALRREVASLLAACEEAPAFFERVAGHGVAPVLSDLQGEEGELAEERGAPDPLGLEEERVGRYAVEEHLGGGGMGVVYTARDARLDRVVALKFLPPHLSTDEEAKERFRVEARAAAALEHPNVCTIHEIGEDEGGRLFIVMPFYEGETLKKTIARGPLSVEDAVDYATQIAEGLSAAHAAGIVHRDVKPANVMVTSEGMVKVVDFGVAKMTGRSVTRTGMRLGTVAYMSPEQTRGAAVDHRTDVWSLGVVLYEMLTGTRPFEGEYRQAILGAIRSEEPEPVRAVRPEVPAALDPAIESLLAKRPEERYDRLEDLVEDLQRAVSEGSGPSPDPASSASARQQARPARKGALMPEGERVQATLVVSKLAGYADLFDELPPEDIEQLMGRVQESVTEIVERHGGVVNQFADEEIEALFGIPTTREDDFARAVRAAQELHEQVRALSVEGQNRTEELRLRSGIDTGPVVARRQDRADPPYQIVGRPRQGAARLAFAAETDEILVSPETRRLSASYFETEAREPVSMKGRADPVTPHRVVGDSSPQTRLEAAEREELTPFTGREKELGTLRRCLEKTAGGNGQFVTVVGEAGQGKSRLLYEFRQEIGREAITLLEGCGRSRGSNAPYQPFIEALRHLLQLEGEDPPANPVKEVVSRVRAIDAELEEFLPLYLHLLSIESDEYPLPEHLEGEDFRLAMREALSAIFTLAAKRHPVVLMLEDWHWADEASREVLEQLAEMVFGTPLLVVVAYRPEYTPDWSTLAHHTPIHLGPLEASSSTEMMKSVLGVERFPEALGTVLYERTGGNPFFLEEVCRVLREEGTIRVEEGRAVLARSLDEIRLPDTVQAVLRTRLHRMDRPARSAIRVAAVIGREFSRNLLEHVLSADTGLLQSLDALRDAGLIQQTSVLPEATYRFKHALTREVAYESLLQHQRKRLHGQVGEALEALSPDRLDEQFGVLARHFSRAENWPKAVRYGHKAAQKAEGLNQFPEALDMLERVEQWLSKRPDDEERMETLIEVLLRQERLCETLGRRERQREIIGELLSLLEPGGDPTQRAEVYVRRGDLNVLLGQFAEAETALGEALRLSRDCSDADLERKALRSMSFLRWYQEQYDEAVAINETVLAIDRRQGDDEAVVGDLVNLCTVLRRLEAYDRGLTCVEEALDRYDSVNPVKQIAVLESAGSLYRGLGDYEKAADYLEQALALSKRHRLAVQQDIHQFLQLASLRLEQGKTQECLQLCEEAVQRCRELQYTEGLSASLLRLGDTLLVLDRPAEALPHLREAADLFSQLREQDTEVQVWSKIATACEREQNYEDAEAAWEKVKTLQEQLSSPAGACRALEGLARAAREQNEPTLALRYYREALSLAQDLGDRAKQGELHNCIGIVEWNRERYEDALAHYEEALGLFEELGDAVHAGLMLNSIGVTLQEVGRHEEAIGRLEEALALHRQTEQKQMEGHALAALGDAHFERDLFEDARSYYEASLQLREALDDRTGEGWMLQRLARTDAAQEEPGRAQDRAERAAEIAVEVDDEELMRACRRL